MDRYLHLELYPDARRTLTDLKQYKLAILSNGSPDMLNTLVRNTGFDAVLDATISIDSKRIFKPKPEAYSLIEDHLGVTLAQVMFVSSNPWDAIGAKSVGLNSVWIERVSPEAMAEVCRKSDLVQPLTLFMTLRMQMDELGLAPLYRVHGLSGLAEVLSSVPAQQLLRAARNAGSRRGI
jgi:2-haloacid dehalogenase